MNATLVKNYSSCSLWQMEHSGALNHRRCFLVTNFAGLFSFYDVLFGSAYLPKEKKPKTFGIDHPMPSNYLALLAYPFIAWTAKHQRSDPSAIQPQMSNGGEPAQPRHSAPTG